MQRLEVQSKLNLRVTPQRTQGPPFLRLLDGWACLPLLIGRVGTGMSVSLRLAGKEALSDSCDLALSGAGTSTTAFPGFLPLTFPFPLPYNNKAEGGPVFLLVPKALHGSTTVGRCAVHAALCMLRCACCAVRMVLLVKDEEAAGQG